MWLLWSFQRVTRRYRMRCDTRGLHLFGPIRLTSSDPFGWLETGVKLPGYNSTIERVIETEESMFPLGTTVVLISAASTLNDATVEGLLDLRVRGAAIHLVLTGDVEHELTAETYDLPLYYPGGKERWRELVGTINRGGREGISSTSLQLD